MKHIVGKNVDELFIKISRELLESGEIVVSRGMETKELSNVFLELSNPENNMCTLKSRGMSEDYLEGEMEWYSSGSLLVEDIAKYSSFWKKLANRNGTVNSNYGFLVDFMQVNGRSQYQWCFDRLNDDLFTRQALINYNNPSHKFDGNKDFVCTISQQFCFRNGGLDSTVLMRSNDLIFGLTYDIVWFTNLQLRLARDLGVNVGKYLHYDESLHVYARHYDMLEDIAAEEL